MSFAASSARSCHLAMCERG